MPNSSSRQYWSARNVETLMQGEMDVLEYEKKLKRSYERALSNMQLEVDLFYAKYADENGISLLEARKKLNKPELGDFKKKQKLYLKEVEEALASTQYNLSDYEKFLKTMSGRAYVTRMEELMANIRHNIEMNSVGYHDQLGTLLKDNYQDSFYRTMFDTHKRGGVAVSFTAPGKEQLETAVREKWNGDNYSGRIYASKVQLMNQLAVLIPQEFVQGKGSSHVARELMQRMNVNYNNAKRLMRTEMNYISNKGTMAAYKESGIIEKYEFLATLDSRTSNICASLDGKIFDLKEAMVGINQPPLHPHCRSTTIPWFEEDDIESDFEDRVMRDEEGNTVKVGKDVTYQEWVETHASAEYVRRIKGIPQRFETLNEPPVIEREFDNAGEYIYEQAYKIADKIPDKYDAELAAEILLANDWNHAMIVANMIDDIDFVDTTSGSYYTRDEDRFYINLAKDSKGNNGKMAYETFYHELGHLVDNKFMRTHLDADQSAYLSTSESTFGDLLRSDYKEYEKKYRGELQKYNPNIDITLDVTRKQITRELFENPDRKNGVSDVIGGVTKKKVQGKWGHSASYWNDPDAVAKEAFAHLFSAHIVGNEVSVSEFRKYFPNALKEYNRMIEDVVRVTKRYDEETGTLGR